jgi:hypothetical protein
MMSDRALPLHVIPSGSASAAPGQVVDLGGRGSIFVHIGAGQADAVSCAWPRVPELRSVGR